MTAIEEAMTQTVLVMWESVIGTAIVPTNGSGAAGSGEPSLVGCIHVTGPEGGVVTLECPEALARDTAAAMFQLPVADVSAAEAQDALGELTNIMGGNLKAVLCEGHQLSLPTVVEGSDFRTRFIGTRLAARVGFDCSGKRLVASFFREGARAS